MEVENKKVENFESLEFRGSAKEFFKIWIVNIFLTFITLGIYSAWAKVRTNKYLYSNTFLKGSAFEYTADPVKILKGRLIVFFIYLAFVLSANVFMSPILTAIVAVLMIVFIPWVVNKAVKFKLKNTKYRNIRFKHDASSGKYYEFFILHFLLNLFTLGLAFPFTHNKFKELVINNSYFGTSKFDYEGSSKRFFIIYIKIFLWYLTAMVLMVGAGALIGYLVEKFADNELSMGIAIIVIYLLYIFLFFFIKAVYDKGITNYIWDVTTLSSTKFSSRLRVRDLTAIYIVNTFAIILSLGLLTPWAKIRLLKYKTSQFFVDTDELDSFIASESVEESAIGDASEDFFDFDIGI